MKKVMQLSENVCEQLDVIRKGYFGGSASASEYRDSFILCEAVEHFSEDPAVLFSEEMAGSDCEPRVAKSLTLRAEVYEKLSNLATITNLSYAEVTRRIILFTIEKIKKNSLENSRENTSEYKQVISSLKTKILVVEAALDDAMTALNSLVDEVEALETKRAAEE